MLLAGLSMAPEDEPVPAPDPAPAPAPLASEAPPGADAQVQAPPPAVVEMPEPVVVETPPTVESLPSAVMSTPPKALAPPPSPEVELPERDGRGLIRGAIAGGAVGWGAAAISIGSLARGCRNDACDPVALTALIGLRWVGNGAALGLAIPGAYYRARYHATAEHLGLDETRTMKRHVWGGAAALGIGAAGWLITRFAGAASIVDGPRWDEADYAGYFASLQISWSIATVGASVLTYGLAHDTRHKELGTLATVQVLPQLGRHDAGLSVAGRF